MVCHNTYLSRTYLSSTTSQFFTKTFNLIITDCFIRFIDQNNDGMVTYKEFKSSMLRSGMCAEEEAKEVNEKLANASETNAKITEACEEYRPVAHRATLIYFLIAEFASVNVMYQTSLNQFLEIFMSSMDDAEKAAFEERSP